jgi:hypothetical protein
LDDVDAENMTSTGWLPMPRARGTSNDTADAWLALPGGGPQQIVITGFPTAAEQGLKPARRGAARGARPGAEMFQSLCGMLAGGARTILISRWRTGGRTNLELVREFVQELPQVPATEAWQRACLLARGTPLDAENEPRLKGLQDTGELPTADHPFFWAGYLLVDTSPQPQEQNHDEVLDRADADKAINLHPEGTPKDEKQSAKAAAESS